jgi:hypothetical protein
VSTSASVGVSSTEAFFVSRTLQALEVLVFQKAPGDPLAARVHESYFDGAQCGACRRLTVVMDCLRLMEVAFRRRRVLPLMLALLVAGPLAAPADTATAIGESCTKPGGVQRLVFSASEYPNIRRHFRRAVIRRGWPLRLVLNRPGADERRDRLLEDIPTKDGFDRDEYPPAVGRGRGPGLERGRNPRGWKADVRYVPSSENRSHGASLGAKLREFCDGTRFRYVFG